MASTVGPCLTALQSLVASVLPSPVDVFAGAEGTYIANEQVRFGSVSTRDTFGPFTGPSTDINPQTFNESYDISLQARSFSGGDATQIALRWARVVEMRDAIRDALAADLTLAGQNNGQPVVARAYVAASTVNAGFDESGNGVAGEADLLIHVDAYGT